MDSYYHVLVQLKAEEIKLLYSDLSENELKQNFLKSYKKKGSFLKDGLKIDYSEIQRVEIRVTENKLKEELKIFREKEKRRIEDFNRDPDFTLISVGRGWVNEDIKYRGVNVTNTYVNDSLNKKNFNLKWFNNPWLVTIVGGLILAFIVSKLLENGDDVVVPILEPDTTQVKPKDDFVNEVKTKELILNIELESIQFNWLAEGESFLPAEFFWKLSLYKNTIAEKELIGVVAGNELKSDKTLKKVNEPGTFKIGKSNSFLVNSDSSYSLKFLIIEIDQFELKDSLPEEVNDPFVCTDSGDFDINELGIGYEGRIILSCSERNPNDIIVNISFEIQ